MKDVEVVVRDGQRLGWLENECQNGYVGFIVALDWRRFQATPNMMLLRWTKDLLASPPVNSLLSLLPPRWSWESFGHYHGTSCLRHVSPGRERQAYADQMTEQVVQFALSNPRDRGYLLHRLSSPCAGCALFLRPPNADTRDCVGCRRGGFLCRGASSAAQPGPSTTSDFVSSPCTLR